MEIVVEELVNIMEVVVVNTMEEVVVVVEVINTTAGVVINTMEVVAEVNIMEEVSTMEAVTIKMKWPGQCLTIMEQ